MNMIERVARAMCRDAQRKRNEFWDTKGKLHLKRPEGISEDHSWYLFKDQARAAIEAMIEPTQEMLNACGLRPVMWDKTETSRKLRLQADKMRREDWNTMVNAALAPGDS